MSVEKYTVTKESAHYTILPNAVLKNLRDPAALGIWCYLSSLPPNWEFYKDQIRTHFMIGRDRLQKVFNILKKHNLISISLTRNKSGQILTKSIHVKNGTDFKREETLNHSTENPSYGENHHSTEKPSDGETAPINTKQTINTKHIFTEDENLVLPEGLPQAIWHDFEEHRSTFKPKFSSKARELTLKKLMMFRAKGMDVVEIIENSIRNGWKDVFEIRKIKQGSSNANQRKSNARTFFDSCKSALEGTRYDKRTDPLSDCYDKKYIN